MSTELFYGIKVQRRRFLHAVIRTHVLTGELIDIPAYTNFLEAGGKYISQINVNSLEEETGLQAIRLLSISTFSSTDEGDSSRDVVVGSTWESLDQEDYRSINHAALYEIEKECLSDALNDLAIACGTAPSLWVISE